MKLTFTPKEFQDVLAGCLDAFSKHPIISEYLHAIEEILMAGMDEYLITTRKIELLNKSAFGFRSMACLASNDMIMACWQELTKNRLAVIEEEAELSVEEKQDQLLRMEKAIQAWCDFWKIQIEIFETTLHDLYYQQNDL